jgi:hypothetical protein
MNTTSSVFERNMGRKLILRVKYIDVEENGGKAAMIL